MGVLFSILDKIGMEQKYFKYRNRVTAQIHLTNIFNDTIYSLSRSFLRD